MGNKETPADIAQRAFQNHFGDLPERVVSAPGRVNLIGEHTDYNDGFVFPAAIDYSTAIAASSHNARVLEVIALNEGGTRAEIPLDEPQVFDETLGWTNYVRGVVNELKQANYDLAGGRLVISGDVPLGAGLSSSASFEIALIRTLSLPSGESISGEKAAQLGQAAENNFVGCNCGIMDQLISALGRQAHALLIDCRSLETTPVALPEGMTLLVVHSNVKRKLVDGEYNTRRAECESVASYFKVAALRDVSLDSLQAAKAALPDSAYRRARHVITENARTTEMKAALEAEDVPRISALMAESHLSMKADFEITVPEIDALVAMIHEILADRGGVRMTGGGFGGCVVALCPDELVDDVVETVNSRYPGVAGHAATIIPCIASDGAFAEQF